MFKILIMNVSGNNQLFERKDFWCPQKDNRKTIIYSKQEWKMKTYCSQQLFNLAFVTTSYLNENSFTLVDISDEILCLCEVGHIFHCALLNMKILHRLKTRIMSWLPVDGGRAYRGTKLPECHWEGFQDQASSSDLQYSLRSTIFPQQYFLRCWYFDVLPHVFWLITFLFRCAGNSWFQVVIEWVSESVIDIFQIFRYNQDTHW